VCSGCHGNKTREYPTAPNLFASCWNCHEKNPQYNPVLGEGRKVKLAATASGPETDNLSDLIEFFNESFSNSGFEMTDGNAGEISANYDFEIKEVFDGELLPDKYKVRLFKGACKIAVLMNGKTVYKKTVESKMRSGAAPAEIVQTILHYLKYRAYDLTASALSKALEKQGE
jgi:hypothetical protein